MSSSLVCSFHSNTLLASKPTLPTTTTTTNRCCYKKRVFEFKSCAHLAAKEKEKSRRLAVSWYPFFVLFADNKKIKKRHFLRLVKCAKSASTRENNAKKKNALLFSSFSLLADSLHASLFNSMKQQQPAETRSARAQWARFLLQQIAKKLKV